MFPKSFDARRGSALIGILIVLAIIIVVIIIGPFGESGGGAASTQRQVTQAQASIERSADVSCAQNRNQVGKELAQVRILNDNRLPGMEALRDRLYSYRCPRGGAILIGQGDAIYCTKHAPPPIQEMRSMIELHPAAPEHTPPPLPQVTPMR